MNPRSPNGCERLRYFLGESYSRNAQGILAILEKAQREWIMAEEYDHPVLSKSEAIRRAREKYDLALDALYDSLFCRIKAERGEWVTIA